MPRQSLPSAAIRLLISIGFGDLRRGVREDKEEVDDDDDD